LAGIALPVAFDYELLRPGKVAHCDEARSAALSPKWATPEAAVMVLA
jgi:hypothetical protein